MTAPESRVHSSTEEVIKCKFVDENFRIVWLKEEAGPSAD